MQMHMDLCLLDWYAMLCRPCQLTVVVPEHWLVSTVGQSLVPHGHLASLVRHEHHEELCVGRIGSAEKMRAQPDRVFFAVVGRVPVAIRSGEVLTQPRCVRGSTMQYHRTDNRGCRAGVTCVAASACSVICEMRTLKRHSARAGPDSCLLKTVFENLFCLIYAGRLWAERSHRVGVFGSVFHRANTLAVFLKRGKTMRLHDAANPSQSGTIYPIYLRHVLIYWWASCYRSIRASRLGTYMCERRRV